MFVVHIIALEAVLAEMSIYLSKKAQIAISK